LHEYERLLTEKPTCPAFQRWAASFRTGL
jgi:hypothetical protein